MARRKADENNVTVGNVTDVRGELNIAGGDIAIYKGYSVEQVTKIITQIKSEFQPKPFDGRCPYKGLDVFEEEDAELFFGRERLVEDLVNRVKESRTVFITGPSGSGKSSLVRAGLIHALKQGAIKNLHSERWLYETLQPGREPMLELARVASSIAGTLNAGEDIRTKGLADASILAQWCEIALKDSREKRVLLFMDQFEEVFTQISQEAERVAFLNLLTHAATTQHGRVVIPFAMRSDFVSNCATYPELNALLGKQFIQIGSMQPDELVSAIAQPALRVGLQIDPDLIAQIINDMHGEPGALPLMQFALKDLFDAQQLKGGVIALTRNGYFERGGIHKALERHADEAFARLSEKEQELARSIFSGLIEIGRGTQDTKRTALFDELIPADKKPEEVQAIVQKLSDARLITTDEQAGKDIVTISHEKLIDAWPWLRKLVNENRDAIALQNEIAADAKEWDDHKRDSSYLYTGARLINSHEQLQAKKLVLSGLAQEFIVAGHLQQQRRQVSLIAGISAIFALLVVAVIIFSWQASRNQELAQAEEEAATTAQAASTAAVEQRDKAQQQAKISRAGELAAQSIALRDRNFPLSILLGIEAYRTVDMIQTRGTLLDNAEAHLQILQYLAKHTARVSSVAFSPDGKTIASGSDDSTIILWDVGTRQPIGQPLIAHTDWILSVAFSPDGKTLASGSKDSTIILWDVGTRQPIGQPLTGHTQLVSSVAFSPDGKTLASGSKDKTIILWDVGTRQPIGQPLTGHTQLVSSVAFSPDGKTLASGSEDKSIILWDMGMRQRIGQPLTTHTDSVYSVAFSPDGETLASGGRDSIIILWDVSTHQLVGRTLTAHTDSVYSVAFSPDGKTLASASDDNTIILWDVGTHLPIGQPLTGHTDSVYSVAFSPDGQSLVSGSSDHTMIIWHVETHKAISPPLTGYIDWAHRMAFSPDGKTLASGSDDNTIVLWDVSTRRPIGPPLIGHTDRIISLVFSLDGKTLASGSDDNTIILWDTGMHQPIGQPLTGHSGSVSGVVFSPDGKTLASGSEDKTIILWDVGTHQPIGQPLAGHADWAYSVAFSPDGKTLASGSRDNTIILWDVSTRQPTGQPLTGHVDWVLSMTFSPDGKTLVSGSRDNTIILWGVEKSQLLDQPFTGHTDSVLTVAISPDGKTLASGGRDSTIILWDVSTHQPIGQPLTQHADPVYSVAFSPDGETLASGSRDNTIILWEMNVQSWIEKTCQRIGRNFTQVEWEQYFAGELYRKTCPQLPEGK